MTFFGFPLVRLYFLGKISLKFKRVHRSRARILGTDLGRIFTLEALDQAESNLRR